MANDAEYCTIIFIRDLIINCLLLFHIAGCALLDTQVQYMTYLLKVQTSTPINTVTIIHLYKINIIFKS